MKSCLGTGILILVLVVGVGGGYFLIQSGMNSSSVPSLVWGALLIIFCSFLIISQLIISDRIKISSKVRMWVMFAVPLAVLAAAFVISLVMLQNTRPPAEVLSALSVVCDHKGVAAAAVFDPAESDQPRIIVLSSDGSIHPWTSEAEPDWRPASIDQVQLAVCLGEIERRVTDTCTAQHGTIKMEVEEIDIEIIAARSGETLTSRTVTAFPSPECPIQGGFYKPSEWHDRVTSLNYQDVESFITIFLAGLSSVTDTPSIPDFKSDQPDSHTDGQTTIEGDESVQAIIGVVTVSSARVRSGPGTQYGVVAGLRNGVQVKILGRNPENNWYQIELPDGTSGWLSTELIQLVDEEMNIPIADE